MIQVDQLQQIIGQRGRLAARHTVARRKKGDVFGAGLVAIHAKVLRQIADQLTHAHFVSRNRGASNCGITAGGRQ